jgi:polyisoprenoid-binding protein YceI
MQRVLTRAPTRVPPVRASTPVPTSVPAPGLWRLDPATATVTCSGRASRLAPSVWARLAVVAGHVAVAENPEQSSLEVVVDLHSLTTGKAAWDQILHAADPLGAAASPLATYRSSAIDWQEPGHATVDGFLGLATGARAVVLDVEYEYDDAGVRLAAAGVMAQPARPMPGLSYLMPRRFTLDIRAFAVPA